MEGEPTTAGCRAVAERAVPAPRDAACMAGARAAGARIVGRTNLHELALGVTGINPWYGTPVNPLDPDTGAGRLIERIGGGGGHRGGRRGLWQRHRRLHPHPGRLLRHGRTQDDLGQDPARRRLAPLAELRHRRPHGPRRGRSGRRHGSARTRIRRGRDDRRDHRPASPARRSADRRRGRQGPARRRVARCSTWTSPSGTRPPAMPDSFSWSRPGSPTGRWWRATPKESGDLVRERLAMGGSFDAATIAGPGPGSRPGSTP